MRNTNFDYLFGQDRITGELFATRSEVIAQNGMVAASHPSANWNRYSKRR